MFKRIKNNMRKKSIAERKAIAEWLANGCYAVALCAMFTVITVVGGVEYNTLPLKTGFLWMAGSLSTCAFFVYMGQVFEVIHDNLADIIYIREERQRREHAEIRMSQNPDYAYRHQHIS